MRNRHLLLTLTLAGALGAVACGDDGGSGSPDARLPDAAIDAPACVPVDDGNPCTEDLCENNTPVNNPTPGAACPMGGTCDSAGMCIVPSCTDGTMNGTETGVDCGGSCAPASTCDTGEGCAVAADCTSGVCGAGNTCAAPACGDGVVQAGEMCDDGNMTNGDGCDDGAGGACRPTGCGNGVVTGTETCDDGNTTNGDGCDNNCTATGCGNGVTTAGETCDDGNTAAADGCSATCATETGYTCTGAPSACATVCGDGVMAGAETCDDGNTAALDGCSATCRTELTEIEPNEDGTPSTGGSGIAGNDFDIGGTLAVDNATAQGVILASGGAVNVLAALSVGAAPGTAGDEDVFAIRNDTAAAVELRVDVWNRAAGFGLGVACGTSIDTGLNLRDAAGVVLASNDDRNGATDRCSGAGLVLAPGATVYAHVVEYGDDVVIPEYGVQIQLVPVACGDGRQVPGYEECDDGNTTAGDGCSATCTVEGTAEVEPNEDGTPSTGGSGITGNDFDVGGTLAVTNATAQGVHDINTGGKIWLASLSVGPAPGTAGDEDVFAVTNAGTVPWEVQADTWDPTLGRGRSCVVDTGINVRNAAGVVSVSNDQTPTGGNCSRVIFVLTPGQTRYVHVTEFGDNSVVPRYVLELTRRPVICGDGVVTAGAEACDDGNTTAGDGCSATCTVEPNYGCSGSPSVCTPNPFTPITLGCTDMSTGTTTLSATGDDTLVATAALPFPVTTYGTVHTHFAASTNGWIALLTSATATRPTSSTAGNATTVPSTASPNDILAPFWDDLVMTTPGLVTKTTGVAGSQVFTVQWQGTLYLVTGSSVTFQLQLHENGPIEYHYCAGAPGTTTTGADRISGSSATIAAENAAGTVGSAVSINTANVITWGTTAYRWVIP
ncbi:MAG: DUF4215 domain-containing protein [Kofleriaceae bacterium]